MCSLASLGLELASASCVTPLGMALHDVQLCDCDVQCCKSMERTKDEYQDCGVARGI